MNVLISNVGRRGYLVDYFKALGDAVGKVYTSDCDPTASGLYGRNDGHFLLPKPVDDEKLYVKKLIETCEAHEIGVVLPVIDPEIYILSGYREELAAHGVTVVVSDRRVLDVCFDKLKMNAFLDELGLHCPKTFQTLEAFDRALEAGEVAFPVVLKPILGSGSVDTYFPKDKKELTALFSDGMIIQEKLVGPEFGSDTFNSFAGEPLRCVIKKKISMRSGETDKSVSVHNETIEATLLTLARALGHVGNLDCDLILVGDTPYIIDLNPRFGGGYPATHAIGVDLVDLLCRLLRGESVAPEFGNYEDDILVMKQISVCSTVLHGL